MNEKTFCLARMLSQAGSPDEIREKSGGIPNRRGFHPGYRAAQAAFDAFG
jgi:hypothetical protein